MSDLKLKDVEGLNGNIVNALANAGVHTLAEYMAKDNSELVKIPGIGPTSVGNLAKALRSQIEDFRAGRDPVAEATVDPNSSEGILASLEQPKDPNAINPDDIVDPEPYTPPAPEVQPEEQPANAEDVIDQVLDIPKPEKPRVKGSTPDEVFAETEGPGKAGETEEPVLELRPANEGSVWLVDVNPGVFRTYEEAVSFMMDWMIASQPFVTVPPGESLQKLFVNKWPEHVRELEA